MKAFITNWLAERQKEVITDKKIYQAIAIALTGVLLHFIGFNVWDIFGYAETVPMGDKFHFGFCHAAYGLYLLAFSRLLKVFKKQFWAGFFLLCFSFALGNIFKVITNTYFIVDYAEHKFALAAFVYLILEYFLKDKVIEFYNRIKKKT